MPKKESKKKAPKKKRNAPKHIEQEEYIWNWDEDYKSDEEWNFDDDKW